jgi:peptidoglycan/LPS O-acetylase OafA/YrhL
MISLDVLRGIAILLVLGHHCESWPSDLLPSPAGLSGIAVPEWYWRRDGWIGVDLFFVLSGFLVGGLLIKEIKKTGKLDGKRFLVRRGYKIWPQYYVFLIVASSIAFVKAGWLGVLPNWPNLVHLQGYFYVPELQTWTLAVEEHFYTLVVAALVLWNRKSSVLSFRSLLLCGTATVVICLLLRIPERTYLPSAYDWTRFASIFRLDSLGIGVCLAALYHLRHDLYQKFSRNKLLLILLIAQGFIFVHLRQPKSDALGFVVGYPLLAIACAASLVLALSFDGRGRARSQFVAVPIRILSWIGVYSYGIYLWHMFVEHAIRQFLAAHPAMADKVGTVGFALLFMSGGILLGAAMSRLVEIPMLQVRDRLFPPRIQGAATE